MSHPVLYSYRRCPYAMRARMGLFASGLRVEQREIVFWDKPASMLEVSPKGTVPVLVLEEGRVLEESLDILVWAVSQQDRFEWWPSEANLRESAFDWIALNDNEFKGFLDGYKYADRFPEKTLLEHRQAGEVFLEKCEHQLNQTRYLVSDKISVADIAVFPFIRQFAQVDKVWWAEKPYPNVAHWLEQHLQASYFKEVMKNRPVWNASHQPLWVIEPDLHTKDQFVEKAGVH